MEVKTAITADLPLVEFDVVLMERVLVNLLENAAKYGHESNHSSNSTGATGILVSAEAPAIFQQTLWTASKAAQNSPSACPGALCLNSPVRPQSSRQNKPFFR